MWLIEAFECVLSAWQHPEATRGKIPAKVPAAATGRLLVRREGALDGAHAGGRRGMPWAEGLGEITVGHPKLIAALQRAGGARCPRPRTGRNPPRPASCHVPPWSQAANSPAEAGTARHFAPYGGLATRWSPSCAPLDPMSVQISCGACGGEMEDMPVTSVTSWRRWRPLCQPAERAAQPHITRPDWSSSMKRRVA